MLLALVAVDAGKRKKIIIDYRDQCDVIIPAYHWADLYAKINLNASTLPEGMVDKLLNIPPSFAIRIWNPFELLFHLFENFFKANIIAQFRNKNIHLRPEKWVRYYLSLLKRQKLRDYTAENELKKANHIFFVSTWWSGQTNTNAYRSYYLLSCVRHPEIDFEGGFFYNKKHMPDTLEDLHKNNIPSELIYDQYLSNKDYTGKTKKSAFVFNTPAVHHCHGWKLGEFLSMGKAIISTPLSNELPAPLTHGKEIFIAKNKEEIEAAIDLLLHDNNLRHSLEKNAKEYFDAFASPDRVIDTIIKRSFNRLEIIR
jgi:glycosyltransferase involved in cell wall biosynthesis